MVLVVCHSAAGSANLRISISAYWIEKKHLSVDNLLFYLVFKFFEAKIKINIKVLF
jgi:hypothetical protein